MHELAVALGEQSLVLSEKVINPNGPLYVRLVGRQAGLVDFLLTILGINTHRVLEVYEDYISYSAGSLSGNITTVLPISNISNMTTGFLKPVLWFIGAIVGFCACVGFGNEINNVGLGLIIGLCVAAFCILMYFLRKTTYIGVIPNSSVGKGISFKRSIIENKNISEAEAQMIVNLINTLIIRSHKNGAAAPIPQMAAAAAAAPAAFVPPVAPAPVAPAPVAPAPAAFVPPVAPVPVAPAPVAPVPVVPAPTADNNNQ